MRRLYNKYLVHYDDSYFNSYHQNDDFGQAKGYGAATSWIGTDKQGKKIELLDIDEHFIEHSQSFVPSIQKVIANALKDESIFLDKEASIPKLLEKLTGYAGFF